MRKILTIAVREYWAMVGTRAFLISIIMMPVLMLGSLLAMKVLQTAGSVSDRRIAVVDLSGDFFDTLKANAVSRNERLFPQDGADADTSEEEADSLPGYSKERYLLERIDADRASDALLLELSERIRNQELYAFVVIPPDLETKKGTGEKTQNEQKTKKGQPKGRRLGQASEPVRFYAQDSSLSEARGWLNRQLSMIVREKRFKESDIDPEVVARLSAPVPVVGMGLMTRAADGSIVAHQEDDMLKAIFLPMGVMMLMFMVIFMASQPMLESVLEEKSQRIAEVLLGSASPFQLMMGKLLGTVAGSLTVFAIYAAGALTLAVMRGWTDQIPIHLLPWFVVFQVLGVLFYASIFLAIGASVSQLKEAQSMLLPVWVMMMSPMFVWIFIIRDPLGPMAQWFSLFPPATPTTMMLRMATGQTIPTWQPVVGVLLTLATTLVIVVLAARIFRVGILWQGKTPKLSELLRWAISG